MLKDEIKKKTIKKETKKLGHVTEITP